MTSAGRKNTVRVARKADLINLQDRRNYWFKVNQQGSPSYRSVPSVHPLGIFLEFLDRINFHDLLYSFLFRIVVAF